MVESNIPFGLNATKRYISPEAERILFLQNPVSSGYVELIDYMGGDGMVERVATAGHGVKIFSQAPDTPDFLKYLKTKGILTPFKSTQLKFNFHAPIEVALLFVYNQDASVNEYSGRYSTMLASGDILKVSDIAQQHSISIDSAKKIVETYNAIRAGTLNEYSILLDLDFSRELARSGLGINNDTKFFWKNDLESLARFVTNARLQLPKHNIAREYIEAVAEIAGYVAPHSWEALLSKTQSDLSLSMPLDSAVVDAPLSPGFQGYGITKRVTVPALEEILFVPRKLLDHGSLQAVDYMGDDPSALAQAARTSYGDGTKKLTDDANLIESLIRDEHTSPIEMAELAVESKSPVFADPRQAKRHRTLDHHGFMGYIPIGDEFYLPEGSQIKYQDRLNRQGRGKDMEKYEKVLVINHLIAMRNLQLAGAAELRELGASEDIVRKVKGVGFYTRGWRTGDALSWSKFFKLRSDVHAQYEVRVYSDAVQEIFKTHLPMTYKSLQAHTLNSMKLSSYEQAFVKEYVHPGVDVGAMLLVNPKFSIKDNSNPDNPGARKLSRAGLAFVEKLRLLGQEL